MWRIITSQQVTYNYKQMEIIDDLPVKNDLDKYLSILERIVYFVDGHRYYVDTDLCFGIYLINGKNLLLSTNNYKFIVNC